MSKPYKIISIFWQDMKKWSSKSIIFQRCENGKSLINPENWRKAVAHSGFANCPDFRSHEWGLPRGLLWWLFTAIAKIWFLSKLKLYLNPLKCQIVQKAIWMISKRVSRLLKLPSAQIPRSLPQGAAAFLLKPTYSKHVSSWLATSLYMLDTLNFHHSHITSSPNSFPNTHICGQDDHHATHATHPD